MESAVFGMIPSMITSAQCRAARGLLDWTQQHLADQAGVGIVTVRQFEAGLNEPIKGFCGACRRENRVGLARAQCEACGGGDMGFSERPSGLRHGS
jgi:DNA-binding XRE family transcriptional regulator